MSGSRSSSVFTSPLKKTASQSSDYFDDDPEFSKALATLDDSLLFGSQPLACIENRPDSRDEEPEVPSSQALKRKRSFIPALGPENSQDEHGSSQDQQVSTLEPTTATISALTWNSITNPITPAKTQDMYHASKFGEFGDYFRRKRAKLQNQNADLSTQDNRLSQSSIFKALAIYITGRTIPSLQILRSLILQHGGQFHAYLDRKEMVTHVITSNLTPAKALEFKNMRVVRPEWLLESIAASKLLPWTDYRWSESDQHSSPIHNATPGAPMLAPSMRSLGDALEQADKLAIGFGSPLKKRLSNPKQSFSTFQPVLPSQNIAKISSEESQITSPNRSASPSKQTEIVDLAPAPSGSSRAQYAIHAANPDAERLMESAEWREAHTSASGETFIQGYYQHSRLHHLSKWKSELRILVAKAQEDAESQLSLVGLAANVGLGATSHDKGKSRMIEKVIMHCDFDSFFVSAGLITRPELRGKPVVVCHSSGKGVDHSTSEVASASYAAREFGVKNGMSLGQAKKLCSEIQTIPYEFERYKELSLKFYTTLMSLSDDLQAVSVDEALIDVSTRVQNLRTQAASSGKMGVESYEKVMAEMIRNQVREKTGCEVSVGIGPNIMLARLATKRAKPAGSFYLSIEDAPALIADLDIVDIHGFAGALRDKAMIHLGTSRLGELAQHSKAKLQRALGDKSGERIWNAIRGIDDRALESDKPRKSVSADVNYGIRFQSHEHAEKFVHALAKEVSERLRSLNKAGRSLTLKIMKRHPDAPKEAPKFMGHGKCETFSKTCAISGPRGLATDDSNIIGQEAWKLLRSMQFDPTELRGVGIQIQKLDDVGKPTGAGIITYGQLAKRFQHALAKADAAKQKDSAKTTGGLFQRPDLSAIDIEILGTSYSKAAPGCKETPYDLTGPTQSDSTARSPAALPQLPPSAVLIPKQPALINGADGAHKGSKAQPRTLEADVTVIDVDALETQRPAPGARELPYDLTMLSQLDQETLIDIMGDGSDRSRSSSVSRFGRLAANSESEPLSPRRAQSRRRITNMGPPASVPDPSKYFPIFKRQFAPIPDQELVALGIDPITYANMSKDRQKELVLTRRAAKGLDGNGRPIYQRKRRFVEDGDRPVHRVILAGRTELPALRAAAPGTPAVTETNDVQDMIRLWVETKIRKKLGPDPREVAHFGGFLEKSMATDNGMQRSVEVMKWWKDVCMKNWGIEQERRGQYGREWWVAWWEVKDKLDVIVKKRFGGKLNLD